MQLRPKQNSVAKNRQKNEKRPESRKYNMYLESMTKLSDDKKKTGGRVSRGEFNITK